MITVIDLLRNADERLKDATLLCENNRFDGAVYLSGYVLELALKARICKTLKWISFPETGGEFKELQSFKVHNLRVLLRLSGFENRIQTRYEEHWQTVSTWSPELRYRPTGSATDIDASNIIMSTKILLEVLR